MTSAVSAKASSGLISVTRAPFERA
jgi:hypothetical protein